MPEQHHKQDYEHDQPNQTMTAAAIVATAISIVAATSAEQQNEDENQDEQAHDAVLNWSMRAVLTAGARDNSFVERKVPAIVKTLHQPRGRASRKLASPRSARPPMGIETHGGECL
jgi:hypothetical protein